MVMVVLKYFLDTEFNGFGGDLISLALAPEDGAPVYLALPDEALAEMQIDPWVARHVLPVLATPGASPERLDRQRWGRRLASYFKGVDHVEFVADWPDDIRYLMQAITLKPGMVIELPEFSISCVHAASWPNQLQGAVRHNALWDARALRQAVLNPPQSSLKRA